MGDICGKIHSKIREGIILRKLESTKPPYVFKRVLTRSQAFWYKKIINILYVIAGYILLYSKSDSSKFYVKISLICELA